MYYLPSLANFMGIFSSFWITFL